MAQPISIVDYGVGNVASIANMLKHVGHSAELVGTPEKALSARKIILPGVGAFDHAAAKLSKDGLGEAVRDSALRGVPVLGVCLGMQLLLDSSDEGDLKGLGLIPGAALRFPRQVDGNMLRVPHMGWNEIERSQNYVHSLPEVKSNDRFYFVHSYFAKPVSDAHVLATTNYGGSFASMIQRENIIGVQFHPEKSHRYGMRLLTSFAQGELLG